jgi:hypothetical protein
LGTIAMKYLAHFPTIAQINKNYPTICITIVLTIKNISKISHTVAHATEYFPTILVPLPMQLSISQLFHLQCPTIARSGSLRKFMENVLMILNTEFVVLGLLEGSRDLILIWSGMGLSLLRLRFR